MYKIGPVQQKLLLLLAGGIALGMETSSIRYYRKLRMIGMEWKRINQNSIRRSVRRLCEEKLVEEHISSNGSFKLVLTEEGKRQARIQSLFRNSIRFNNSKQWDGKWRVVMFDIPEKSRNFRTILREHLWELRFYKLQHSVFISPYPCEKQLVELIMLYRAESFVRVMTVNWIDKEEKFRRHFFNAEKSIQSKAQTSLGTKTNTK